MASEKRVVCRNHIKNKGGTGNRFETVADGESPKDSHARSLSHLAIIL